MVGRNNFLDLLENLVQRTPCTHERCNHTTGNFGLGPNDSPRDFWPPEDIQKLVDNGTTYQMKIPLFPKETESTWQQAACAMGMHCALNFAMDKYKMMITLAEDHNTLLVYSRQLPTFCNLWRRDLCAVVSVAESGDGSSIIMKGRLGCLQVFPLLTDLAWFFVLSLTLFHKQDELTKFGLYETEYEWNLWICAWFKLGHSMFQKQRSIWKQQFERVHVRVCAKAMRNSGIPMELCERIAIAYGNLKTSPARLLDKFVSVGKADSVFDSFGALLLEAPPCEEWYSLRVPVTCTGDKTRDAVAKFMRVSLADVIDSEDLGILETMPYSIRGKHVIPWELYCISQGEGITVLALKEDDMTILVKKAFSRSTFIEEEYRSKRLFVGRDEDFNPLVGSFWQMHAPEMCRHMPIFMCTQ